MYYVFCIETAYTNSIDIICTRYIILACEYAQIGQHEPFLSKYEHLSLSGVCKINEYTVMSTPFTQAAM